VDDAPDPAVHEGLRTALRRRARGLYVDVQPWIDRFEERAAILQSEAGLPRAEAERRAKKEILAVFLESLGDDRAA
jgi:hypothetical protein